MTSGVQSNYSAVTSCDMPCDLMPCHESHCMIPQDKPSPQDHVLSTNLQEGGTN